MRFLAPGRVAFVVVALVAAGFGVVWAAQQRARGLGRVTVSTGPPLPLFGRYDRFRPALTDGSRPREFYFTRGIYSEGGWRGWGSWAVDFPKADRQVTVLIDRLINVDIYPYENAIRFDDPDLRRFPWMYILEVGDMALSDAEVNGLRDYLESGGFLVVDDFWGSWEWANFDSEIRRVLPEYPIVEVPLDHPIFHMVYNIGEVIQVPNVNQGARGGPTWEQDGYEPHVRGIFDDKGRLMVVINWNTDLGDAWEWAERPEYPLKYSTFAVEMGINFIVYGMSH